MYTVYIAIASFIVNYMSIDHSMQELLNCSFVHYHNENVLFFLVVIC